MVYSSCHIYCLSQLPQARGISKISARLVTDGNLPVIDSSWIRVTTLWPFVSPSVDREMSTCPTLRLFGQLQPAATISIFERSGAEAEEL